MNILVFGKDGQLGKAFQGLFQRSATDLGSSLNIQYIGRAECDLSNENDLNILLAKSNPNLIINAAAYTAVDKAENEIDLAFAINAKAPEVMARFAAKHGATLMHYSTDYVFDGSGTHARQEVESTGPLSVYGQTKLDGEKAIVGSGCKYLIFRTSWVYAARGGNFAKTMLRLAQERDQLTVINDQHGAPTGADLIADVTAHAMRRVLNTQNISLGGVYHLVASGETTWHGYASHVIAQAKHMSPDLPWKVSDIAPVPTAAFATPAARPLNSRLCTNKLQQAFGLVMPPWQQGVDRMLAEIL